MRVAAVILTTLCLANAACHGESLELVLRDRVPEAEGSEIYRVRERTAAWDPQATAIVICDMWNRHWCASATRRVGEMAPAMNEVLKAARARGVLIVHAPSDCLQTYADTPQRRLAAMAPQRKPGGVRTSAWQKNLDREPALPIDDSDGGCDCQPQCKQGSPWRSQIAVLEIAPEDAISDSGEEILNLFAQRGIENVVLMGVHTNMCVLGRSFGLRQMARAGLRVVLARDLTDTMYNPRKAPEVSHERGTRLVIEHIEKYVCPSIESVDLVGEARRPQALFMIGEDEYDTKRTLPEFAHRELEARGWDTVFVHAREEDKHDFPGLEALADSDVLVLSVRRRTPTEGQLAAVRAHLEAGRPLVGIRTASHAFDADPPAGHARWSDLDVAVLGGDYLGHYGNKPPDGEPTLVEPAAGAATSELLSGLDPQGFRAASHLYKCRDLGGGTRTLLLGRLAQEGATEPVAWTNTYRGGRIFYTSLGGPGDFALAPYRRLLVNALYWSIERAPKAE